MASVSEGASDTTRSGRPALLGGGAQAMSALATSRAPRRITSRTFTAPARLSTRALLALHGRLAPVEGAGRGREAHVAALPGGVQHERGLERQARGQGREGALLAHHRELDEAGRRRNRLHDDLDDPGDADGVDVLPDRPGRVDLPSGPTRNRG